MVPQIGFATMGPAWVPGVCASLDTKELTASRDHVRMLPPLLRPLIGDTHVHSGHSPSLSLFDVLQVYQSVKMVDIALMVTVPVLILMLGGGVKLVS